MIEVLATLTALACMAGPVTLFVWATNRFLRRRRLTVDRMADQGAVFTWDLPLLLGLVIMGAGALLGGAGLIPLLVWVFDGDPEGRRVFVVMLAVVAGFVAAGAVVALPGLRIWIVGEHGLTRRWLRMERTIPWSAVSAVRERRSLTGSLGVETGTTQIVVPMQVTGFDDFVARARAAVPAAAFIGRRRSVEESPEAQQWTKSVRGTRLTVGFLVLSFVFCVSWPWFVEIAGDHPVRDGFLFVGVSLFMWAVVFLLVAQQSFQRNQPAAVELRPGELAWRLLGKGWQACATSEVFAVSVETDIVYVKGMPGYRYPLRVTFVSGDSFVIDDFRARHMGTSTHAMARAIRAHVHDLAQRPETDRERSLDAAARAEHLESNGMVTEAAAAWRLAIAAHPAHQLLARYARVGDLERRSGHHATAVSCYRAHLDIDPDDPAAWEGLAASFTALGRRDLAAEAVGNAERLLLRN